MKQNMKQNIARAVRGGSWYNGVRICRSAYRYQFRPDDRGVNLGFRIVSCSPDTKRVVRGGSWDNDAWYCRSAYRYRHQPDYRGDGLGFRVTQVSE